MLPLEQTLDHDPQVIHTPDQRITTQAAVLRELDTIRMVLEGRGMVGAVASTTLVDEFLKDQGLTAGQQAGIRLAATTRDAFIAWQGVAGAGKSYALNLFRRIAESQGYRVRGFAPSAEAAKTLGESAQIRQTETVAALIHSQQPSEPGNDEIWVVDEAGLLSAKDAQALIERARDQRARAILVGDTKQLSAVEAGNPFKSLQQAGITTAYLTQSLRQKNQQIKAGVDLIAAGKIAEGIEQLKPFIHQVASEEERAQAIACDYLALTPEERTKTLVLAGTNKERLVIQLIREGLKAEGTLGKSVMVKRLKARDLTEVQGGYAHHFRPGNVLIPNASYKRLGLGKGQRYEVLTIDTRQNVLTLQASKGVALVIDPTRVRKKSVYEVEEIELAVGDRLKWTRNDRLLGRRNGQEFQVADINDGQILIRYRNGNSDSLSSSELTHLDHALVSTTYAAQGKSAERIIGALDHYIRRNSFYVVVSRVKHDLRLYPSEDLDSLIMRVEKSNAKENPREILESGVQNSHWPYSRQPVNSEDLTITAQQLQNLVLPIHKEIGLEL